MPGQRVGYVRVSTVEQNADRQLDGVAVEPTFVDRASGSDTDRPELEAMRQFVRAGDSVVVHSMDRLARNLGDLRHLVESLTARGVSIEFVKEHLAFTGEDSPIATLMLSVMGAVGQHHALTVSVEGSAQAGMTSVKRPILGGGTDSRGSSFLTLSSPLVRKL
jgi:DNA invertase Pin-like site-specific DNA recombinase